MKNKLNENVIKFFELYEKDPSLRARIEQAESEYPGCLEIRDAVAQAILLPIAEELGLPFTVSDLRKYETRVKMQRFNDENVDENAYPLWLLDRGWEDDPDIFTSDEN